MSQYIKIVLIIQDPKSIFFFKNQEKIRDMGIETATVFTDSADALRFIASADGYDAVVISSVLSEGSGIDIAKRIKEFAPKMIIAFISQERDYDFAVRALRLGAVDCVDVPVDGRAISNLCRRILRAKAQTSGKASKLPYFEKAADELSRRRTESVVNELGKMFDSAGDACVAVTDAPEEEVAAALTTLLGENARCFYAGRGRTAVAVHGGESCKELKKILSHRFRNYHNGMCCATAPADPDILLRRASDAYYTYLIRPDLPLAVYDPTRTKYIDEFSENFRQALNNGFGKRMHELEDGLFTAVYEHGFDAGVMAEMYRIILRIFRTGDPSETFKQRAPENTVQLFDMFNNAVSVMEQIHYLTDEYITTTRLPRQRSSKTRDLIPQVKKHIAENPQEELGLDALARLFSVSPKYLSSTFKSTTGQNITDYVNEQRVEKARTLLAQTDMTISSISYLCGYSDYYYFAKVFKKITGKTPTEYRSEASPK